MVLESQLVDPHLVRKVLATPDADDGHDMMNQEMENLHAHDIYELVPCMSGIHTICLA